ncbi:MAG: type I pullulanase, partial [Muribaculaceae bacterium]|nr:type I pullulanase [Muribaculaceae bacterium]
MTIKRKNFLNFLAGALICSCSSSAKDIPDPVPNLPDIANLPGNNNTDLGVTVSPDATRFKLWSPQAQAASVNIYDSNDSKTPSKVLEMKQGESGTWVVSVPEQLYGKFYTFQIKYAGKWLAETPGVWAKAIGINGNRAAIIDFASTNPEGWKNDQRVKLDNITDAVIYEMHHRDFSMHPSSGINYKGKFLALTEQDAVSTLGDKTGIDHLKELGITHVHILPSYDFSSVDESNPSATQYNCGYAPLHYNVPEGSY